MLVFFFFSSSDLFEKNFISYFVLWKDIIGYTAESFSNAILTYLQKMFFLKNMCWDTAIHILSGSMLQADHKCYCLKLIAILFFYRL